MNTADNTAKIVDFNAFKQRREQASYNAPVVETSIPAAPFMMWYPVWVLVPQPYPNPTLN